MAIGVYVIRNKLDGKVYVGSSSDIGKRWTKHRNLLRRVSHHCRHLQRAWNLHGIEAFEFAVVEHVIDLLFLEAREQFWIWRMNAADPTLGYNTAPAAGSMLGLARTEETKRKLSAAKKGKPLTQEHRAALRAAWSKNPARRAAIAEQMRKVHLGVVQPRWLVEKRASPLRGRPLSESHRAALRKPKRRSAMLGEM